MAKRSDIKNANIKDVARYAGVSIATVSRVLGGKPHVRNELKDRVYKAVQTLNYNPNRVARSLRSQTSSVIGLIISDIQNSFFNPVVRAIEDIALENGYAVFLCNSDEDTEKELLYLNLLKSEKVAGVILTPARENANSCSNLIAAGIPVVAVDRRVPDIEVDTVLTNNIPASQQLVNELISRGHKRISAVLSDITITTGRERFEGYKLALAEAGIDFRQDLVRSGLPKEEDGYLSTLDLLEAKQKPSAIFTGNKLISLGALRAIYEKKLKIPEDIAFASFDALDWMPNMPEIIFAEQPTYALGEQAAKLLFDRIKDPKRKPKVHIIPSTIHTPQIDKKTRIAHKRGL